MALFTSTPKSKAAEKLPLLALDSDDENSSGYDSPVYINDEIQKEITIDENTDCDISSEDNYRKDDSSSFSDDDLDDLSGDETLNETVMVTNTKALLDNIRYILSMPNLCDVTFLVGPQRVPIYGLKSILGVRNPNLLRVFLRQSIEAKCQQKMKKKKRNPSELNSKTTVIIDSYDTEVFRSLVLFLHSGCVTLDATTVIGLLCCAAEFEVPDLCTACWEFIERCTSSVSIACMVNESYRYEDHPAAQNCRTILLSKNSRKNTKRAEREPTIGKETEV